MPLRKVSRASTVQYLIIPAVFGQYLSERRFFVPLIDILEGRPQDFTVIQQHSLAHCLWPEFPDYLVASNNYYGGATDPQKRVSRGMGPKVSVEQSLSHAEDEEKR